MPLEYAEWGVGEPLLVSHGNFHGCDDGLVSARHLGVDGRVIAPSRFGYLGSTLPAAAGLARGFDATLRVLTIDRAGDGDAAHERFHDELGDHLAAVLPPGRIELDRVAATDVTGAFVSQARSSSLVVIGASRDWVSWRTLAGAFVDDLANRVDRSIVMLRPNERRSLSWWRRAVGVLRGR